MVKTAGGMGSIPVQGNKIPSCSAGGPKEAGWGWRCGVGTQRCRTHPAELRGQGGGLAEGRKLGAGAVESDVIIKHVR